jgi:DNA helicase IV
LLEDRPAEATTTEDPPLSELSVEQDYVAMLYERLDSYRRELTRQLADVRLAPATGTHQWRTERDALSRNLERRLSSLSIGDVALCFGRLDLSDGSRLHVGRVGISSDDHEPLLVDWRAPVASLFYRATPGAPEGVVRRRHLLTKGQQVIDIDDEVFDLSALEASDIEGLHGDAALLAAVGRARTGQMSDIVATIQREQDAVIRSDLSGVLVVQGGPGTGKTAVALHRAAYLLYAYRNRLVQSGVLVVGPNPVFLRYIEQVLPSLGETGALLATPHGLYPGIRPTRHDSLAVAQVKGDEKMVAVLRRAIADRQRVPREDLTVIFERSELHLSTAAIRRARQIGRQRARTHNQARPLVENVLLEHLLAELRDELTETGGTPPSPEEVRPIRRSLRRARDFRVAMERIWPILTAEQLLNDLFGTPALLRSAGRELAEAERDLLLRDRESSPGSVPWSIEDVPLLDEAAELLGSATDAADQRRERVRRAERRRELAYARRVLGSMSLDIPVDVEQLADRFADPGTDSLAAQAANDRTWKFGHVIVDEAQELSPMAWRMIFRRNPNRSMTIVGDLAQSGAPWAPASWSEVLDRHAPDRWRITELTVNYRTPREIMALAAPVLAAVAPDIVAPIAIRDSGQPPRRYSASTEGLDAAVTAVVGDEVATHLEGRVAVIAPDVLIESLRDALTQALPGTFGDRRHTEDARVVLLGVRDAKGLEFDAVVLVEPAALVAASPKGHNDLYVALTRATQRLAVVHATPLPEALAEIEPAYVPA